MLRFVFVAHHPSGYHSLFGRGILGELNALGDVALQAVVASLEQLLLVLVGAADNVNSLLGSAGAKLDGNGEELGAGSLSNSITTLDTREVDEAGLDEALLALGGPDDLVGESRGVSWVNSRINISSLPVASVGHGESSGTGTILGLDDLVTTELNAYFLLACRKSISNDGLTVYEGIQLLRGDADAGLSLAEQRNDGLAGVTTNDGDVEVCGVLLASDLSNEGLGTDNIECGDTEKLLGVEDTSGLEDLGGDGNCGVDGVGDDKDVCLGAVLGNALNEALDNAGVDLEQIVTGHTRLACG